MKNVTIFEPRIQRVLEAFNKAVIHSQLKYSLNSLKRYAFSDDLEIGIAIKKSIVICKSLGISSKRHFGYFYKVDILNRQAVKEWKASKLGIYLMFCNGRPDNPFTGALQFEMLSGIISRLD